MNCKKTTCYTRKFVFCFASIRAADFLIIVYLLIIPFLYVIFKYIFLFFIFLFSVRLSFLGWIFFLSLCVWRILAIKFHFFLFFCELCAKRNVFLWTTLFVLGGGGGGEANMRNYCYIFFGDGDFLFRNL